jgi:hypothetical protein
MTSPMQLCFAEAQVPDDARPSPDSFLNIGWSMTLRRVVTSLTRRQV